MNGKIISLLIIFLSLTGTVMAQGFKLEGRVTDENQSPIEFSTVICTAQGKITMTNIQGEFSLEDSQ